MEIKKIDNGYILEYRGNQQDIQRFHSHLDTLLVNIGEELQHYEDVLYPGATRRREQK